MLERSFLKQMIFICLLLISIGFTGCGGDSSSSSSLSETYSTPTDREFQPVYTKGIKFLTQDSDNDGACDYIDFYPEDSERVVPDIIAEQEFNNNINQATDISNNATYPVIATGSLTKGQNYYLDTDYFKFIAKSGDRISIIIFKGTISTENSIVKEIKLDSSSWNPNVSVLKSTGSKTNGISIFNQYVSGLGVEIPEDGTYYIEISDPEITADDYSYPYVLIVQKDTDFDGVSDDLEKVLGSDIANSDTDGDEISDFEEIFVLINDSNSILNECSTAKRTFKMNWWDVDNDGIPNWYDVDSDEDGPPDRIEGVNDEDSDNIPNFLDTDSNENGIPDEREVGESFKYPVDNDKDGIYDFADLDKDNDGIPNNLDDNDYEVKSSNYVFDKDSLILVNAQCRLQVNNENVYIKRLGIVDKSLEIYAMNLSDKTKVIFPTEKGPRAFDPDNIDIDEGKLEIKVLSDATSGKIYLFDIDTKKLSNGYYIDIKKEDSSPILLPIQTNISPGQNITLNGYNLGSGDVIVVFSNGVQTVSTHGNSNGTSVTFSVPSNAITGVLYVQMGKKESNRIFVNVIRNINVNIQLGKNIPLTSSDITLFIRGKEYKLDDDFNASIPVENNFIDFISSSINKDLNGDGNADISMLYEAVVLPGQDNIVLNATSTAVKWVFFNLGYYITQPPSKWSDIINVIENTSEVQNLASYIDTLLQSDLEALSKFEDAELIEKFKNALIAASDNVANLISKRLVEPDIAPSDEQYDISLTSIEPADLRLLNDTELYLSVSIKSKDGKLLRKHITSPWDSNIVKTKVDLKVSGRDSTINVITAGRDDPKPNNKKVYRYVIIRTVFDGIIVPPLNDFVFNKLLGKKIDSEDIETIISTVVGPEAWSDFITAVMDNNSNIFTPLNLFIVKPVTKAFKNCFELPPGDQCLTLAKGIGLVAVRFGFTKDKILELLTKAGGKEIVARLTPLIGQIKATLDALGAIKTIGGVLGTINEMAYVPGEINFDVDYPLEIDEVKPLCVSKTARPDYFFLLLEGKGFLPYTQGHLWWKKEIYPEVLLNSINGEVYNVNSDGTMMIVRYETSKFSDGDYTLKVKHQGQEYEFKDKIEIYGGDQIKIVKLEPSAGKPGDIIKIYGCGFGKYASDNEVYFTSEDGQTVKGTVLSVGMGYIIVRVPEKTDTGPVYVKTSKAQSNSLDFTVQQANVTITFGDCGALNDDTFALYVDGSLIYSMPSPSRPFPVDVDLTVGTHEVKLVGITAPDNIGTYCISFSSNVEVSSGVPLSGDDLTAGVVKTWIINVSSSKRKVYWDIEGYVCPELHE